MVFTPSFTHVAWVPWAPNCEKPGLAHELAIDWVLTRAAESRTKPVLRVHSHAHDWTHPSSAYSRFAKAGTVVTDRGHGAQGPTLVPSAYSMKLIAGAMSSADGHALVLEEHPALPVEAWAGNLGAVNLRTGQVTPDTSSPGLVERVSTLASSLYNGWSSLPGSSAAKHRLPELAAAGMTWDEFVGTLLAIAPHHVDEKGMLRSAPAEWKAQKEERLQRNLNPDYLL
jgi:hypothetical protein